MYALITIVGIVVTIFFLAGFWRGCMNAIANIVPARPSRMSCRTIVMAGSRRYRSLHLRWSLRGRALARHDLRRPAARARYRGRLRLSLFMEDRPAADESLSYIL
jgi:hypothetical protein